MSTQNKALYRQEALDRLSSPEQLDEAIVITSPGGWMALTGVVLLLACFVVWGFTASIPTRIAGQGILLYGGGQVVDAMAAASGALTHRHVEIGDRVREGDVLAEVSQPDVATRLDLAKAQAAAASEALDALRREQTALAAARNDNAEARKAALEAQIDAAEQRQAAYRKFVENQERLAAGGVTTASAVQQAREQLSSASLDIATARTGLLTLSAEQLASRSEDERRLFEQQQKVLAAEAEVRQLDLQLSTFGKITSPSDGVVVEWKAPFGAYTQAGSRVASIASGDGSLQFMLYVPPAQGKRVQVGMPVHIELGGMQKEEWGTLVGRVKSISDFPATFEGMQSILQNEALVSRFSRDGAPFAVQVELERDPATASGYRWSGGTGALARLSPGTTGTARITVDSRQPASFVLPFLKKVTGL